MSQPPVGVSLEQAEKELEAAHLLVLRHRYQEAHDLLRRLRVLYPDRQDVADLLTEVTLKLPLGQPKPSWTPRGSIWTEQLNPALALPTLLGLWALVFGLMTGIPAVQAAGVSGIGGTMAVEGRLAYHTVAISTQLTKAGVMLALALVCGGVVFWLLRRD